MNRIPRVVRILVLAAVIGGAAFFTLGPGKDLVNLWRHGVIQSALDDSDDNRKFSASRDANLKAIYIALNLYQDSEGQYPAASGWMDAIGPHLQTTDMSREEADKKLLRPNLKSPQPGQYGYALNDAIAGRFKGDIKDSKTPLVFETSDLSRNAHGSPNSQTGRLAITLQGTIVKI
jgi:hypothetical protein